MKTILIISLMVAMFCPNILGQIEKPFKKGNLITGGTISASFEKDEHLFIATSPNQDITYTTKQKTFETALGIGYFLFNQLAVGIKDELLFSSYKTKSDLGPGILWDVQDRQVIVGPFIRYYFDLGIFLEAYGGIGILSNTTNNSSFKFKTYNWSTGIGYCLLLKKNVAIEPSVKYSFLYKKDSDKMETISTMNLIFSLGFQIYLDMKNKD